MSTKTIRTIKDRYDDDNDGDRFYTELFSTLAQTQIAFKRHAHDAITCRAHLQALPFHWLAFRPRDTGRLRTLPWNGVAG